MGIHISGRAAVLAAIEDPADIAAEAALEIMTELLESSALTAQALINEFGAQNTEFVAVVTHRIFTVLGRSTEMCAVLLQLLKEEHRTEESLAEAFTGVDFDLVLPGGLRATRFTRIMTRVVEEVEVAIAEQALVRLLGFSPFTARSLVQEWGPRYMDVAGEIVAGVFRRNGDNEDTRSLLQVAFLYLLDECPPSIEENELAETVKALQAEVHVPAGMAAYDACCLVLAITNALPPLNPPTNGGERN